MIHHKPSVVSFAPLLVLIVAGCAQPGGAGPADKVPATQPAPVAEVAPATRATAPAAMQPWKHPHFAMEVPEAMPEAQEDKGVIISRTTADKIDPSFQNGSAVTVDISIYHQSDVEFQLRKDIEAWANRPLPPSSAWRVPTLSPARIEKVTVPGGAEAMISISEHPGEQAFGTGGERALSLRLFVKPERGSGAWVVGASATGPEDNPQLSMTSRLEQILEYTLRSFQVTDPMNMP